MITKIWYSVQNSGDGAAYLKLMESEQQAKIDQKYMDVGWAESCVGCIEVVSGSPPICAKNITYIGEQIKEIEAELDEDYMKEYKAQGQYPEWFKRLEGQLKELKEIENG